MTLDDNLDYVFLLDGVLCLRVGRQADVVLLVCCDGFHLFFRQLTGQIYIFLKE